MPDWIRLAQDQNRLHAVSALPLHLFYKRSGPADGAQTKATGPLSSCEYGRGFLKAKNVASAHSDRKPNGPQHRF